jgi:hypothetical protein
VNTANVFHAKYHKRSEQEIERQRASLVSNNCQNIKGYRMALPHLSTRREIKPVTRRHQHVRKKTMKEESFSGVSSAPCIELYAFTVSLSASFIKRPMTDTHC